MGASEDDKERMGRGTTNSPDAGAEITAAVLGTNGKVYDASDHVEEKCGA